jgi:hypothetical protein
MTLSLLFLVLLSASVSQLAAQDQKDVGQLLKAKGPPTFTARSIEARGNLLVCEGFELFDPAKKNAAGKLPGRVLLFCEPWDALWLWAAHTDQKMQSAAPLLGLEGPGKKFTDLAPAKPNAPSKLTMPARVFTAVVGKTGVVFRTAEIAVHELQCKD